MVLLHDRCLGGLDDSDKSITNGRLPFGLKDISEQEFENFETKS